MDDEAHRLELELEIAMWHVADAWHFQYMLTDVDTNKVDAKAAVCNAVLAYDTALANLRAYERSHGNG
jgi:hypothetical protein